MLLSFQNGLFSSPCFGWGGLEPKTRQSKAKPETEDYTLYSPLPKTEKEPFNPILVNRIVEKVFRQDITNRKTPGCALLSYNENIPLDSAEFRKLTLALANQLSDAYYERFHKRFSIASLHRCSRLNYSDNPQEHQNYLYEPQSFVIIGLEPTAFLNTKLFVQDAVAASTDGRLDKKWYYKTGGQVKIIGKQIDYQLRIRGVNPKQYQIFIYNTSNLEGKNTALGLLGVSSYFKVDQAGQSWGFAQGPDLNIIHLSTNVVDKPSRVKLEDYVGEKKSSNFSLRAA